VIDRAKRRVFAKFGPQGRGLELKPFEEEHIEQERLLRQHVEKRRKMK
jgi:hypothetical protein